MPGVLTGSLPAGTAPPVANVRYIGSVALDTPPRNTVREIVIPSVRMIQAAVMTDRRRQSRVKEDTGPLVLEVRGYWHDDGLGLRFRDFAAALLSQQQVPMDNGDGTEYRMVDVDDILPVRLSGIQWDWPGQLESWSYVAKVRSYEPYSRLKGPVMAPQQLFYGGAAQSASFAVAYAGTAPGEPTWQMRLVVPDGIHSTTVQISNDTTGERCTVSGLSLGPGVYYILMDASGSDGGMTPRTPNNNGYGLLIVPTTGYGVCMSTGGAPAVDLDFSGNVPTLAPVAGSMGGSSINAITASVATADGAVIAATLTWLAPTRYIRL